MKTLDAEVLVQLRSEGRMPVLLLEIAGTTPLRFAASKADVVFPAGGNTYTAKFLKTGNLTSNERNGLRKVDVELGMCAGDLWAYHRSEPFKGRLVTLKAVYRGAMHSADNYIELFQGRVEAISADVQTMRLTLHELHTLRKKWPHRIFQRTCPWLFGDTECNTDSLADITGAPLKVTGTADSGTTLTLVDNALTQADDFWKFGRLTCTKYSVTESRRVSGFVASTDTVTVEVPFTFAIDSNTTYSLIAGCDKVWDSCRATNEWGPTADNKANFGGFLHVTTQEDE